MELLWSSLKTRELVHLAGAYLADAAEQGIHRINQNQQTALVLPHPHRTHHPPADPTKLLTPRSVARTRSRSRTARVVLMLGSCLPTAPILYLRGPRGDNLAARRALSVARCMMKGMP
ncbi:hypothetical protein ABZ318_28725 [Streptomyces sp. NPDC006197]|uniref:hypothetical protein n=1 Tax=Streptomyces sp. NPDC006197 TaxID=3156685 RepID=UPI00339E5968